MCSGRTRNFSFPVGIMKGIMIEGLKIISKVSYPIRDRVVRIELDVNFLRSLDIRIWSQVDDL